jgi:FdhD protein
VSSISSERVDAARVERPRVGVSACLLGERVRYDAGHKRDAWLVDELGPRVEWVPVCPEVEIGLGTPREPIRLEREADGRLSLITIHTRRDLTGTMRRFGDARIDALQRSGLDGYVFKADSPSCGPSGVAVEGASGGETGRGLFADAVVAALPDLPVADERELSDPRARDRFVARVFAHCRERQALGAVTFSAVDVTRLRGNVRSVAVDRAAAEEPLEIRVHGRPFAVIMRTPGADRELAAGFLLAERVIRNADDLGAIEHCRDVASAVVSGFSRTSNIVNVTLADASADRLDRLIADRRNVQANSSCGLCGRQTIESLSSDAAPIDAATTVTERVVASLPQRLRAAQAVFDETGGLHAAGLFTTAGELVDAAEDVGRHNAVDKIVGRMLIRERLPLSDLLLFVSGRTSFEIVQKALFAGIPILAAVSAPSSLAIDLAKAYGITLVGFVREGGFNIYTHGHRVIGNLVIG